MSKIFNIDDQIVIEESHFIENGIKTILEFFFRCITSINIMFIINYEYNY